MFIIKRNVIMETSFNTENRTTEANTEINNYNDITAKCDENCSAASNNNNCDNDINRENIKRDTHQIPDEDAHLKDLLRNTFIKNYKQTLEKELQHILMPIPLNNKIDKNIIIAANDIAKDILETIEHPDF